MCACVRSTRCIKTTRFFVAVHGVCSAAHSVEGSSSYLPNPYEHSLFFVPVVCGALSRDVIGDGEVTSLKAALSGEGARTETQKFEGSGHLAHLDEREEYVTVRKADCSCLRRRGIDGIGRVGLNTGRSGVANYVPMARKGMFLFHCFVLSLCALFVGYHLPSAGSSPLIVLCFACTGAQLFLWPTVRLQQWSKYARVKTISRRTVFGLQHLTSALCTKKRDGGVGKYTETLRTLAIPFYMGAKATHRNSMCFPAPALLLHGPTRVHVCVILYAQLIQNYLAFVDQSWAGPPEDSKKK